LSAARRLGGGLTFGGRMPVAVGGVLAATVAASLVGVVGERNGLPLIRLGLLEPRAVLRGELWRVFTWVLFERDPLGLLFGGLVLYWAGRDLCEVWGERRFVLFYLGTAAAAGLATTAVALAWPSILGGFWMGVWPAVDALVVAWALLFPFRQILLFFALPVSGRSLLWFTVGGTALYAVFSGLSPFVPHFLAEGAAYLYATGRGPRGWLRRVKLPRLGRKRPFTVIHADRDPDRRWLN